MINNLQDELYILETKQATGANIQANIRWDLEGEKCSKSFFSVLQRQNMQSQTIYELCTDDKKTKHSNKPQDILKSAKKFYEDLYSRGNISRDAIIKFLNKIRNSKKVSMDSFNLCKAEISLGKIMDAINSQKNKKSPGNGGFTAEFLQLNSFYAFSCI